MHTQIYASPSHCHSRLGRRRLLAALGIVAASNGVSGQTSDIIFSSGFEPVSQPPNSSLGRTLNDTGVWRCSDAIGDGLPCNDPIGTDEFPNQDAEHGRDLTVPNEADGIAGFSFTKLDASGAPLPDQSIDYETSPWPCVRDEVTGLVWEVKTDDGGLHDRDWTYSWYNTSGIDDAGFEGVDNGGQCLDSNSCDTDKFTTAVNTSALCGQNNWRLPTRSELLSIVHYGAVEPLYIDADYFWNTSPARYWTRTSATPGNAKSVSFRDGSSTDEAVGGALAARLTSGGQ